MLPNHALPGEGEGDTGRLSTAPPFLHPILLADKICATTGADDDFSIHLKRQIFYRAQSIREILKTLLNTVAFSGFLAFSRGMTNGWRLHTCNTNFFYACFAFTLCTLCYLRAKLVGNVWTLLSCRKHLFRMKQHFMQTRTVDRLNEYVMCSVLYLSSANYCITAPIPTISAKIY